MNFQSLQQLLAQAQQRAAVQPGQQAAIGPAQIAPGQQQAAPGQIFRNIAVTPTVQNCVGRTATIQFSLSSPFLPGQRVQAMVDSAGGTTISATAQIPFGGQMFPVPFTIDSQFIDFIFCP